MPTRDEIFDVIEELYTQLPGTRIAGHNISREFLDAIVCSKIISRCDKCKIFVRHGGEEIVRYLDDGKEDYRRVNYYCSKCYPSIYR